MLTLFLQGRLYWYRCTNFGCVAAIDVTAKDRNMMSRKQLWEQLSDPVAPNPVLMSYFLCLKRAKSRSKRNLTADCHPFMP